MNELGFVAKHWEPQRLSDLLMGRIDKPLTFNIYDDCDCMTDLPHAYFYREIGEAYRGLKYILTERNEEEWYESLRKHYENDIDAKRRTPDKIAKEAWELAIMVYGMTMEEFRNRPFLAKKRFRDWNDNMKTTPVIPTGDLLVMDIPELEKDGKMGAYTKLCEFLKVRDPKKPFPKKR